MKKKVNIENNFFGLKYRPEIDGLRALAVIPVIFFHAGFEIFSGGFIGVDVFFVISGYLITSIIIYQIEAERFSLIEFYERRARRLFPALFIVIIFCIPFGWVFLIPSDLKDFGESIVFSSIFSSNFLFWREGGYFAPIAELKPLLHTWSLAVEEQYYILFPIFLIYSWFLGIKRIVIILFFIFLLSLSLAHWGSINKPVASFFLLPTRGWEILIGVFTAFFLKKYDFFYSKIINQLLGLIGIILIIFSIIFFDKDTPFPSLYTLIPTLGTSMIIIGTVPNTFLFKILNLRFLVTIGLISYSAYLWHQPMFAFAKHILFDQINYFVMLFLSIASFVLGYLSWKFIEKPFRHRNYISRKIFFSLCCVSILIFSSLGLYINQVNGFVKKYDQSKINVYESFNYGSSYVVKRFEDYHLRDLRNKDKIKVMLIGDSYAQDLLNAIYESGLSKKFDITTFRIPVDCGVLMVDKKKIKEFAKPMCSSISSFKNQKLLELIEASDQVWLSSNWPYWTAEFMQESIKNLKRLNDKVFIFGIKNLGQVDSRIYKSLPKETWSNPFYFVEDDYFIKIDKFNTNLKGIVLESEAIFIDSQKTICNGEIACSNYRENNIISYDGFHLTPFGARVFGENLKLIFEEMN